MFSFADMILAFDVLLKCAACHCKLRSARVVEFTNCVPAAIYLFLNYVALQKLAVLSSCLQVSSRIFLFASFL